MRVLIVGCGYVGQAAGARLAAAGCAVHGLRRSAAGHAELRALGITPAPADLTDRDSLRSLAGPWDWVVNCVSAGGGGADQYRRVYVEGMRNLLGWLADHPPRKLVYTSSTSVYGQDDGSAVDETSATEPPAETGRILLEAERMLLESARTGKIPGVVLRVAGIYGPGRGYWLKQFLTGAAPPEDAGQRIINMIHRDDVAGAIVAALERGPAGEIYNAVDDEPATPGAVFEWLSKTAGRAPRSAEAAQTFNAKRGWSSKRVLNHKLRRELGYAFLYPSFREGYQAELRRRHA